MITITLINNNGAGFSGPCQVAEGTTVETFLTQNGWSRDAYTVRVNRSDIVNGRQVLRAGDTVSVTPSKTNGAGR